MYTQKLFKQVVKHSLTKCEANQINLAGARWIETWEKRFVFESPELTLDHTKS
jgi:hypothetical protein